MFYHLAVYSKCRLKDDHNALKKLYNITSKHIETIAFRGRNHV